MEFATCCGEMVLNYTVKAVWQQLHYVVFYKRNIQELKEKLNQLEDKQCNVQHQINEATRNGEMIEDEVQNWMCAVNEIRERAQQIYEKERQERESRCPNMKSRYQLGWKAKEMAKGIDTRLNQNLERISYREPVQSLTDMATIGESNEGFESRMSTLNEIMDALRDPNIKMVGLCGPGGVGKTTTAKEVARKVKGEVFETVVMVEVTDHPDREKIQREIAEKVDMKLNDETESVRASHLHDKLRKEKNMLLILDDLWEKLEFSKIGIPSDSRVLLTSRKERLLSNEMKCQKVIKVGVMSEDEAWKLFTKEIVELPKDSEILSIANQIVQRCGGLPVRIVAAAGTLRNMETYEWKDVLERLKSPLQRNNTGIEKADAIFRVSYDHLSQESKPIFLMSAMLSHNPLIEDLMMYSVGLGLLQGVNTMEAALVRIRSLINQMKVSNLLLDSSDNSRFAIHDVIRDVALSIASNEENALVARHNRQNRWLDKNIRKEYRSMCLEISDINDLPEVLACPKLQFFILNSKNSNLRIPNTFFQSMTELKVMGFTDMHFSSLPSLQTLQEELQTVCLHSCVLEDIAEVGNLKSLTVLSLAHSDIYQLPWELSRLTSLQILNLAHCSKLEVIPPKLLSSLKRLEVLDMERSFKRWEAKGYQGKGNASLDELKHLTNLSSLTIEIPDACVLPEDLFKDIHLERYEIVIGAEHYWWSYQYRSRLLIKSIYLNDEIQKLLDNVEELRLDEIKSSTDVLFDLHGKRFQKLKHLKIEDGQFNYVFFRRSPVGSFCELVRISISRCKSMEAFVVSAQRNLVSSDVIEFHQLQTLSLRNLPMLSTFYLERNAKNNDFNEEFKSLFSSKVSFPKLETMKLRNLNSLIPSIWDDQLPQNSFVNLKTLIVENCGFVETLIPFRVLKSLNNLEELEVRDCKIPSIWDNELPQNSVVNLKTLIVENCGFIETLIPFHVLKSLSNLEELEVCDCKSLKMVFDFEELKSYNNSEIQSSWVVPLRVLKLYELPKLKHIWSNDPQEMKFFREKVFHKLKKLGLDGPLAMMIMNSQFPDKMFQTVQELSLKLDGSKIDSVHELYNNKFPNLQELELSGSVKKELIFSCRDDVTPIRTLCLSGLDNLKHIWNDHSQLDIVLQHLQILMVSFCDDLINLGPQPSIISFTNLTDIRIDSCSRLINLMTSSTSRGLVQLTSLKISWCFQIEEIITKQQGEEENDVEKDIVFEKLKSLTLKYLPRLRSFCSHEYPFRFPSLEEVIIEDCDSMSMFCTGDIYTPLLKCIKFQTIKDEKLLDNNLNKTIQLLLTQVTKLKLHPEMRNIWIERLPQQRAFSTLEHLIVDNCDFLSEFVIPIHLVRSLINLKVLEVRNCHAIKTIFDLKGRDIDEETHKSLANICLKKLKLHRLPNLTSMWIQDLGGCNCFQNLEKLCVSECESLRNIFVASTAKGLGRLKELSIISCGVEVIIAKDETSKESSNFVFPQLSNLKLDKLSNLKCFYPERCTFEWSQLRDLFVSQCENLKVFGKEMSSITPSGGEDEVETQWPPFSAEKVIPKLKSLSLSQEDVTFLRNSQLQAELFHKVKELYLESFVGESISFPYDFLERFPNLNKLSLNLSSFEEIFPSQVQHADDMREFAQFKELCLTYLDKLKIIWNDDVDSQLPPLSQNLERLEVEGCFSLIKLTPSSALLENLKDLTVSGCHQLTYLITNSTAKSLVNLHFLRIMDCGKMEEIMTNENKDGDGEITFHKLYSLELTNLPILKSFCLENQSFKFPKLRSLTISKCHQMKMFCRGVLETPKLKALETEEGRSPLEGDLNNTIELFISKKDG